MAILLQAVSRLPLTMCRHLTFIRRVTSRSVSPLQRGVVLTKLLPRHVSKIPASSKYNVWIYGNATDGHISLQQQESGDNNAVLA